MYGFKTSLKFDFGLVCICMTRTIAPYLSKYAVVELVNTLESTFLNYEQCHSGERYKGHHGPLVYYSKVKN